MPKKKGPGNASSSEKPLTRPCCGKTAPWRKLWEGRVVFGHISPCRGKHTPRIKYHALNFIGLEMELDT